LGPCSVVWVLITTFCSIIEDPAFATLVAKLMIEHLALPYPMDVLAWLGQKRPRGWRILDAQLEKTVESDRYLVICRSLLWPFMDSWLFLFHRLGTVLLYILGKQYIMHTWWAVIVTRLRMIPYMYLSSETSHMPRLACAHWVLLGMGSHSSGEIMEQTEIEVEYHSTTNTAGKGWKRLTMVCSLSLRQQDEETWTWKWMWFCDKVAILFGRPEPNW
jgi:hypothetical protein